MQCSNCGKVIEDNRHWCVPYANWVAKGMLDFIVRTIDMRTSYKREAENDSALAGFSSCLVIPVALLTETSLKTLLTLEGHKVCPKDIWGHDLLLLYEKLSSDTKTKINQKYIGTLPRPFSKWTTPKGLAAVLQKERCNFERWRYLAEHHEYSLTSNPFNLATVAYAIYAIHVEETDLPDYPNESR